MVETVRKPSPPDPVLVSWSSLKRWENCPQHQLRVIRKEVEKSPKGRIFLPGTVTDLTMRRWLDSDDPQPGQMVDMVEDLFNETVEKSESKIIWKGLPTDDMEKVKTDCRTAVSRLEPWLLENVLPFDYQPEYRFKVHITVPYICDGVEVRAPVTLIGGIDILVRRDNGKFRIYDLKMTKSKEYLHSSIGQLIFYDLVVASLAQSFEGAEEWALIAPMYEDFRVSTEVTNADRQYMMSRIMQYAQGVWADSWEPKESDAGCGWCEAKGMCDKFRPVAMLDENQKMLASFTATAAKRKKNV